jgi:PKD repeat protein
MFKTIAGFVVFAALVAACSEPRTAPQPGRENAGATPSAAGSPISMSPPVVIAGAPVTFSDGGLFDHNNYTRTWDFGDGATGQGISVTHVYENPGAYAVTLAGCDGARTLTATMLLQVIPSATDTPGQPDAVRQP